jgi:hypothetical protein
MTLLLLLHAVAHHKLFTLILLVGRDPYIRRLKRRSSALLQEGSFAELHNSSISRPFEFVSIWITAASHDASCEEFTMKFTQYYVSCPSSSKMSQLLKSCNLSRWNGM